MPSVGFVREHDAPRFVYRQFELNKGEYHDGHQHTIDHPTIVVRGSVLIEWKGKRNTGSMTVKAGDNVIIAAETEHKLTALEDGTIWLCLFAAPENGDLEVFWEEAHRV